MKMAQGNTPIPDWKDYQHIKHCISDIYAKFKHREQDIDKLLDYFDSHINEYINHQVNGLSWHFQHHRFCTKYQDISGRAVCQDFDMNFQ